MKKKTIASEGFRDLQHKADLSMMFDKQQYFNPYIYYYKLYNKFPHRHWCKDVNKPKLLQLLSEKFNISESAIFETHIHSNDNNKPLPGVSAYILADELMLCFPPWEFGNTNDAQLYFSDAVKAPLLNNVLDIIKDCYMVNESERHEVRLLMQNTDNRLDFCAMTMHTPLYNLQLNYNDDLMPLNEMLLHRLNKDNDKGLVIFYGKPGTGKTSYIRYLIAHISKQKLFVPASLTKSIGTPEFLTLLNGYRNSLLIIEDADYFLKKRSTDEDNVIANILNLTDGMLSDFFHIQVVCTFNSEISNVDPALMRKGRLISKYYFKELSLEKTRALSSSLGYEFIPDKEMVLADIFHLEEREYQQTVVTRGPIGFR
ncbi:MAG: AAA family ATPase [Bacteroidota bacterium]